jgi:Acyl-CoA dehydrogenase, N-terminal domain
MVYDMCRKFADEELAPNAGTWDKQHSFPTDAVKQLVRILPQPNLIPVACTRHVGVHLTVLSSGGTWLDGNQRQIGARGI